MGRPQKEKGKRGERQAAEILREMFPGLADRIRRGWQSRFGGKDEADIIGLPFHVEVAVGANPPIYRKLQQALRDAKAQACEPPVMVLTKRDRDQWVVTMPLKDFERVVAATCAEYKTVRGDLYSVDLDA